MIVAFMCTYLYIKCFIRTMPRDGVMSKKIHNKTNPFFQYIIRRYIISRHSYFYNIIVAMYDRPRRV